MVARLRLIKRVRSIVSASLLARCFEIKNVALFLKQKILKLCEVNLPNPITVEAIQYSQCPDVPTELSEFSLAQKIKLVKEWNDTSNHQLKMKYTHGLVNHLNTCCWAWV